MEQSRRITRRSASNLALAFCLLPRSTRDDMAALYAFCRQVDDVVDRGEEAVDQRRLRLERWREDIGRIYSGCVPVHAVCRELQPVIEWYRLPQRLFEELLLGVGMDLERSGYETWVELDLYCYRVASVVGLLSLPIFGCRHPDSEKYAEWLGRALQLTNILRDVATDAARGRIYLPLEEMRACGVTSDMIRSGRWTTAYAELARRVARRARRYYRRAREVLPSTDRRALVAAELMGAVYWRLLQKLERRQFDVFGGSPVRISRLHKAFLVMRAWYRSATCQPSSDYGWD
ncbi:MAG: presqualene diphosphate synthase HpnD [Verrucomicrobiota bacterium]|nr:presqualene diphosphate synthase HpnD [Limisphaera sp.]MDW8382260.1 presqualene diphosphate synthase HpnD [Verrucomicrobiota bacterium]